MEFNKKYEGLFNFSIVMLLIGISVIAVFGFTMFSKSMQNNANENKVADGFYIDGYKVILDVQENNIVKVQEEIRTLFYDGGHHGIYKFIPEWLEYTGKDNKTISRRSTVSNLICTNNQYSIDTVKGKKRIKIGNPNEYIRTGFNTFKINYDYNMGKDPYKDGDEFIFHVYGDYWGTEIKNATLEINLPKNVDQIEAIHFYADKYRKKDITEYVSYFPYGNKIYAYVSSDYKLNKSLTVDIELPEGYFSNTEYTESSNYGYVSFTICIVCIMCGFISFILWRIFGKDIYKVPETVEFYAPENLDSAEVGYIYKSETGSKLAVSLIVQLANKGYIKINEDDSKISIVKTNRTSIDKYINREIKIVKLKDYNQSVTEKILTINNKYCNKMKEYFEGNNTEYIIKDKFDEFYDDDFLIKKGCIKVESDTINNYTNEEIEKIKQELLQQEMLQTKEMSENEKMIYDKLFEENDETVLSENKTFYQVFGELSNKLSKDFDDKMYDLKSYILMLINSIVFLLCSVSWAFAYAIFKDLNPDLHFLYYLGGIANIFIFIFTILMKRKRSYGEKITAKIKGFKNYIELAEKDQIEALVEKNPNYFYDILPYAYVLNVSKKWIEKFENIPIPSNEMGTFNYMNVDAINSISNSIYSPSSSSGGSCGGGCSSCGGGCSSCGGGGSW